MEEDPYILMLKDKIKNLENDKILEKPIEISNKYKYFELQRELYGILKGKMLYYYNKLRTVFNHTHITLFYYDQMELYEEDIIYYLNYSKINYSIHYIIQIQKTLINDIIKQNIRLNELIKARTIYLSLKYEKNNEELKRKQWEIINTLYRHILEELFYLNKVLKKDRKNCPNDGQINANSKILHKLNNTKDLKLYNKVLKRSVDLYYKEIFDIQLLSKN